MAYVFTEAIRRLNSNGMTFNRMAAACNFARSTSWFNKLVNYDEGNPPPPEVLEDLATMMGVSKRRVKEMVAEEWYGVRPDDTVPSHLRGLVAALRGIEQEDVPVVEQLVKHLSDKYTAKILLEGQLKEAQEAGADSPDDDEESADSGAS